jgi:Transposase IS66 family
MGTVKLSSLSRPRATVARLHANKAELLMVLERPEIPLHTNGSENDIRCQVTRRKVSAGTRSDLGWDCRDAFLGTW